MSFTLALIHPEAKVEPWFVLEFEAPLHTVAPTPNDNVRSQESERFKIPPQFFGVPHLSVLGFEGFTAAGLGIDLGKTLRRIGSVASGICDLLGLVAQEMYK